MAKKDVSAIVSGIGVRVSIFRSIVEKSEETWPR